ncbi:hypothetical protein C8J56DRAFT_1063322 [Mycena floridula]|nr:hypothetical protein C8J56DRAFT_1063322 [Mycena floridula]
MEAHGEYHFVDPTFLPVGQSVNPGMILEVAQTAIPKLTMRIGGVLVEAPARPRLTIRINRNLQTVTPAIDKESADLEEPDDNEDHGDLLDDLDNVLRRDQNETDDEDGPDWMFDEGEKVSKDKGYVFCPAVHRAQLLHLFTKHFCQHPIFLERDGKWTAQRIRDNAVYEMYIFCHQRGLREVWAYFWTSWYSPKVWKLWARSSSPYLTRLRTTMTVENFWKQLKHDYLHHIVHPRLDQLVYILIYDVNPAYFVRSQILGREHRIGWAPALTNFQKSFKSHWAKLQKMGLSGKVYITSVKDWTCTCGRQKFDRYHLCKHLVQSVPDLSLSFWTQVIRRRVLPLYRHVELVDKSVATETVAQELGEAEDGSITDGDDPGWIVGNESLTGGAWRHIGSQKVLGKRRTDNETEPEVSLVEPQRSSSPIEYGTADEHQMDQWCENLLTRADELEAAAKIMRAQTVHRNHIWIKSVAECDVGRDAADLVADIRRHETTGKTRDNTWARPKNADDRRRVANVMGYMANIAEEPVSLL